MIKRDFDKEALTWDESPYKQKMAKGIAESIIKNIPLAERMNVLDYGCGTGLISCHLYPFVRSITGVDNSSGMLKVFNQKIKEINLKNVEAILINSKNFKELHCNFDLIICVMTIHHIKNLKKILSQFYNLLLPEGYLCVADLDLDGGKFHQVNDGVYHNGFNRDVLKKEFENTGFSDVNVQTALEITKPLINGNTKKFTIFLMWGKK